jgi:hypothetical protein
MDYTDKVSGSTTAHEILGTGDLVSNNTTREYRLWFGAIVLAALLMRLACFTGLIASDDLAYSHYAQQMSNGQYTPEAIHFGLRYGVIIPVGIVYRFFGVTEWSTTILPLAASTASVLLLMMIATKLWASICNLSVSSSLRDDTRTGTDR